MQTEITANSRCVKYGNVQKENSIYSGLDSWSLSTIKEIFVTKDGQNGILTSNYIFRSQMLSEQLGKIGWYIRCIEAARKNILNIFIERAHEERE